MASFNVKFFFPKTNGNGGNFISYNGIEATNTLAEIKSTGFFNSVSRILSIGDVIMCSAIDGNCMLVVTFSPLPSDYDIYGATKVNVMLDDYSALTVASQKVACRGATTTNIILSGLQTIDGLTTVAGDRWLVKNQTSEQFNGIYIVSASAWTRASDLDIYQEAVYSQVFVESGTINANTGWIFSNPSGGIINTTPIKVVKFSGSGANINVSDYKFSAINADHFGWLLCDGRAINRTIYASLFSLIGISFGAGDGSTTFNIPDPRGRALGAIGQGSGLTNRILGASLGIENSFLTTNELPLHNHTFTGNALANHGHSITDPGHTHSLSPAGFWYYSGTSGRIQTTYTSGFYPAEAAGSIVTATTSISVVSASAGTPSGTISNTGSGNSFSNMQPTLFGGNLFIYAGA